MLLCSTYWYKAARGTMVWTISMPADFVSLASYDTAFQMGRSSYRSCTKEVGGVRQNSFAICCRVDYYLVYNILTKNMLLSWMIKAKIKAISSDTHH